MNIDGHELNIEQLKGTDPVEVIDLTSKRLGSASGIVIAKCIEFNAVLTSIDVGFNDLDEETALSIVRAVRPRDKLTFLGLGSCGIGASGAKEIAEFIQFSAVLKKIVLSGNLIEDEGAIALGESLKTNKSLEELELIKCSIGPEGAKGLADALASGSAVLTSLNLRGNAIRSEGAKALAAALSSGSAVLFFAHGFGNTGGSHTLSPVGRLAGRAVGWRWQQW